MNLECCVRPSDHPGKVKKKELSGKLAVREALLS